MTSETDYILAGRRLGTGLVGVRSLPPTSAREAIVASGGAVYEKGLSGALVDPFASCESNRHCRSAFRAARCGRAD